MMEKMGWTEGSGLGKDGQGMKTALKPQKKVDAAGIGAKNLNTNWIATSSAYDSILAKLNIAYQKPDTKGAADSGSSGDDDGSSKKQKRSKDKSKRKDKKDKKDKTGKKRNRDEMDGDVEDTASASSESVVPSRSAMYAKRMKSKRLSGYSDVDKAEIFASEYRPAVTVTVADSDAPMADTTTKQRIEYENGFTEDTQVDIYNQAMDKKNKGRLGLGQAKLSKSARKEAAERDATLARVGAYLQRKFEYGGCLSDMTLRSDQLKHQRAAQADAAQDSSECGATASDDAEHARKKQKRDKRAGETKAERRARKERKRARKAAKAAMAA